MGWSVGWDSKWERDIGYGVPAKCDHPNCNEDIDRGLAFVCGGEPYGGDFGCGLFFCERHKELGFCKQCHVGGEPFEPKPDVEEWAHHKSTDESWAAWRKKRKGT